MREKISILRESLSSFNRTGGTSGLGQAIAQLVAYHGGNPIICGTSQARGQATVDTIRKRFPSVECSFFPVDVTSEDDVDSLLERVIAEYGSLHGLSHNAGRLSTVHLRAKVDHEQDLSRSAKASKRCRCHNFRTT